MSCLAAPPTFRLLDGLVGWDTASAEGIAGLWDASGIHLPQEGPGGGVPPSAVWPFLPPPRLAYDCATCTWFLVTPWPPASRLLQLGPCDACDVRWRPVPLNTEPLDDLVAVAVHGNLIAVADRIRNEVRVWERTGALVGVFTVADPTHLAFISGCDLLAVSGGSRILRFDPAGIPLGSIALELPAGARIETLGGASDGSLWVFVKQDDGPWLLRRRSCQGEWSEAPVAGLQQAFADTGLTVVAPDGFCVRRNPRDRNAETCCFTWFGRPASTPPAHDPTGGFGTQGQLLTSPIDSGIPRCRWHRVRMRADVPVGTGVEISLATAEVADGAVSQGVADPAWAGFEAGIPHPLDWQVVDGSSDFLIDQPPGRYLYVRVRLTSDGTSTPVVRSLRIDFPRSTSVDALPSVYREDPQAEDFTERFVALFDAALEDLDASVEQFPALLDVADTPADVLPWLGRFLGAAFDPAWDAARRRRILAALPALYGRRGTPDGLAAAVKLVFDVEPAIEEITGTAIYGAVADTEHRSALDARLGSVRLFGRSRVRFRLGASAISRTPLRSYGDPSLDAAAAGAFRFRVLLPSIVGSSPATLARLRQLVDSQKPAHTVASVRVGSTLAVLGQELRVGIDTRLGAPPPPVLGANAAPDGSRTGAGNVRLRRDSILRGRASSGAVVGHTSGIQGTPLRRSGSSCGC